MVLTLISGSAWAASFDVAFPPHMTYIEQDTVAIVLKFDKDTLDNVKIKLDNFEYPDIAVPSGRENFCFAINLKPGMNTISVTGLKNKNTIGTKDIELFFRSDLRVEFKKAPKEFKRYLYHKDENEAGCKKCHNLEPTLNDLNPAKPENSPCYSCHKSKVDFKNVHVPAEAWKCLDCHGLKKGEQKYAVTKPIVKTCYPCHGIKVSEWQGQKMMHGPTAVGMCNVCHDPHGSDWPGLTRMFATDLCLNCHQGFDTGKHVIAGFFGKGHPTRGVPDPFVKEKEFSCAGCHNPHGSYSNKFLKFENTSVSTFCINCHKK